MRKSILQQLPLEGHSFVAKTFSTPDFEVSWHQHPEIELILFTRGEGQSYIGNAVGEFATGDIFLLGSNLTHTFQKKGKGAASAVVIQFKQDFWGKTFLGLPEMQPIRQLFREALQGLKIKGRSLQLLAPIIKEMENQQYIARIQSLMACLRIISEEREWDALSTQDIIILDPKETKRLKEVFKFTLDHFDEDIKLKKVAKLACLSEQAFSVYFKKRTQKTYVNFLNEIRIDHACKQLINTDKSIREICDESGFNTPTNFHRRFRKLIGKSPLKFRDSMS